jgi:uncharacterized protein with HEPN domain
MKPESLAHLHDIRQAAVAISSFIAGKGLQDYLLDELLRSAVERKFAIIGEALARLRRDDPETLRLVRCHREIISFRNILIHGYDVVDDRIVWDLAASDLADLRHDVEVLLASEP